MEARLQPLGFLELGGFSLAGLGRRPPATGHEALGDTLDARVRAALAPRAVTGHHRHRPRADPRSLACVG
jgi:hypothetical protein